MAIRQTAYNTQLDGKQKVYQMNKKQGDEGNNTYKVKVNISVWIHGIIVKDFKDLSDG